MSVRAIRHYDTAGLLSSSRSSNQYRQFAEEDIERVRLIRLFLSVDFTLEEIRKYAPCFQPENNRHPDSQNITTTDVVLLDFYHKKISRIDQHIADLQATRFRLSKALERGKKAASSKE